MRGSNIALHRFFEDPVCGSLPWNEQWVRKMLVDIPKSMHWNSFRMVIGPVPDRYYDIADEAGILVQNEFPIWTLPAFRKDIPEYWSLDQLKSQLIDWMSDSWNHPSLVIWDPMNETASDRMYNSGLIQQIRKLDLSARPWENSYNPPTGQNDMVEFHPYRLTQGFYHFSPGKPFDLASFQSMYPTPNMGEFRQTGQSLVVNEYGWLWMNRDGQPTLLTKRIYDHFLGSNSSATERFEFYAYVLAGHTEYLRAYRTFAGVQHFVYLSSSHPGAITSDNFIDVRELQLEPHFAEYVGDAFKPVGVYLNFWQPKLNANERRRFTIMMINDKQSGATGELILSMENANGDVVLRHQQPFEVDALGQMTYYADIIVPETPGQYLIKASAKYGESASTISRRKVVIE